MMSSPESEVNRSTRKRRFRIVFTALALLLCLITWVGYHVHLDRKIRREVQRLGGRVSASSFTLPPPLPAFSFETGPIIQLELNHPDINDDQVIELLRQLPDLQYVILDSCGVTDEVLKELEGRNLRHLSVMNTKISDNGLPHLVKSSVTYLNLQGTNITDAGLRALKNTPYYLGRIELGGTKVTDAGLLDFVNNGPRCVINVSELPLSDETIAKAKTMVDNPNFIEH